MDGEFCTELKYSKLIGKKYYSDDSRQHFFNVLHLLPLQKCLAAYRAIAGKDFE
jgi:hypothetical protein